MSAARSSGGRLWWFVGFGFALLIGAWTTFIVVAVHHPVPEVPVQKAKAP